MERCDQAVLTTDDRHLDFSAMLSEDALNFFLTPVKGNCKDVYEMIGRIRERFITQERTMALMREWETMELLTYNEKCPEISIRAAFKKMVASIQELQLCLPRAFHDDKIIKSRLLNSCANVRACRLARKNVSPTVMRVITYL